MKIPVVIVRVLMGLMFLFASVTYFLQLFPEPELQGDIKTYMDGIAVTGYMLPLIKAVELLCGLAFVVGRFVALACVVLFPITINILLFHVFLAPESLLTAVLIFIGNLFLFFAYRKHYQGLFAARRME